MFDERNAAAYKSEQNTDTITAENKETEIKNPEVKQLQDLLHSSQFETNFIQVQTKNEQANIDGINSELKKNVDNQLKPLIEAEALKSLGMTDINEARKLGKQWGEALRAVTKIEMDINGTSMPVDINTARLNLEDQLKSGTYAEKLKTAEEELATSKQNKKGILEQLRSESENPSPELTEALEFWGLAPNAKGEYGEDGKGFNSGVIHYFEYRANAEKNGRFKKDDEASIEGFIEETQRLKSLLDNPSPDSNEQIEAARMLEDENGQQRLLIVTKDKEFIVAFQRQNAPMKIISVFPGQGVDKLNKAVEEELNPKPNAKQRLNSLSGTVKELTI